MSISDIEYAHKKVYWAIARMAASELPPRDRLVLAARSHLELVFALLDHPEALTPELGLKITALRRRLTAQGSYRSTVYTMTEGQVHFAIHELLNLHSMLAQALEREAVEGEPEAAEA